MILLLIDQGIDQVIIDLLVLRFDRIAHTRETMHRDGISSVSYRLLRTEKLELFTKVTVDLGKP